MVIALCYMLNTMFYIEPLSNIAGVSLLTWIFLYLASHGYKKAMREIEGYNERKSHTYSEGFEEKIERLKKKYE